MRTRKLRLVSALLALAMLLAMLPVGAFAAGPYKKDGIGYEVISEEGKTVKVVSKSYYDSAKGELVDDPYENNVVIPEAITMAENVYKVTAIDDAAFENSNNLSNVTIPSSVTGIGAGAFNNCQALTIINVPNSVTSIGESAFHKCTNLQNVTLSSSMTAIPAYIFYECTSLSDVAIPSNVTVIEQNAFNACTSLTSLSLPNTVTNIGYRAFYSCTGLSSITLPEGVSSIGEQAFSNCSSLLKIRCSESVAKKLWDENDHNKLNSIYGTGTIVVCYKVTFDADNGTVPNVETVEVNQTVAKPKNNPTKEGYTFVGWYNGNQPFYFDEPITTDTTLTAKWTKNPAHASDEKDETPTTGKTAKLTFSDDCIVTVNNEKVESGAEVKIGATVTVNLAQTVNSGIKFGSYVIDPIPEKVEYNDTTATFAMPAKGTSITLHLDPEGSDDGTGTMTIVAGVAIGAGAAVLTYHIGTELYAEQVLGKGVSVPKTREEVSLKAWELAGKPAVGLNGELLSETAQAERWAVESGLMQNDAEGNFNGAKKMNKLKALRMLDKAQKMA